MKRINLGLVLLTLVLTHQAALAEESFCPANKLVTHNGQTKLLPLLSVQIANSGLRRNADDPKAPWTAICVYNGYPDPNFKSMYGIMVSIDGATGLNAFNNLKSPWTQKVSGFSKTIMCSANGNPKKCTLPFSIANRGNPSCNLIDARYGTVVNCNYQTDTAP